MSSHSWNVGLARTAPGPGEPFGDGPGGDQLGTHLRHSVAAEVNDVAAYLTRRAGDGDLPACMTEPPSVVVVRGYDERATPERTPAQPWSSSSRRARKRRSASE